MILVLDHSLNIVAKDLVSLWKVLFILMQHNLIGILLTLPAHRSDLALYAHLIAYLLFLSFCFRIDFRPFVVAELVVKIFVHVKI